MKGKKLNIRLYFILMSLVAFAVVSIITTLLSSVLRVVLDFPFIVPESVSVVVLSIVLGGIVTAFFSEKILSPITKLSEAIHKVAEGDFTVRLKTDSIIKELQDVYQNFNLMVDELAATEIIQSDFVSNVSHEFKTPINAIEGYATLLQGDEALSMEQAEYADKIVVNTKRLSGLVSNILLLSKIERQVIQEKKTSFRLDEQVRQAVVLLEEKWIKKKIELVADLDTVMYRGNEALLFHVWLNLIDNAIKFSPLGGKIHISLKASEQNVLVAVKDEGSGIAEGEKHRIFDKFYQSDTSHKSEGNGLGLALVQRIVAIHQGRIDVENGEEKGCKFTILLPVG